MRVRWGGEDHGETGLHSGRDLLEDHTFSFRAVPGEDPTFGHSQNVREHRA